jgi:hypothetical protein
MKVPNEKSNRVLSMDNKNSSLLTLVPKVPKVPKVGGRTLGTKLFQKCNSGCNHYQADILTCGLCGKFVSDMEGCPNE